MKDLASMFISAMTVPDWVSASFPVIRLVLLILILLLSVALVVIVMIQPSNSQGMGGITGQSETFFSKNKSKTLEGTLKRLTVIISITLFVLSLLFLISMIFYVGGVAPVTE